MNGQDIRSAFEEMDTLLSRAYAVTRQGVKLAASQGLRTLALDVEVLRRLKRQLAKFDSRTGTWRP